jgi:uncharacterized damage-inducible protein DinB
MDRIEPPGATDERTALTASLDFQRASVLLKIEGLDDEQLRRPMVPSGNSCLALVKHLAAVERGWFGVHFARDTTWLYSTEEDPNADLRIEPDETTQEVLDAYAREIARSREIVAAAASLEEAVPNERRGRVNLRWILIHMIEEYARHLGHLDIMREQIDGATGL